MQHVHLQTLACTVAMLHIMEVASAACPFADICLHCCNATHHGGSQCSMCNATHHGGSQCSMSICRHLPCTVAMLHIMEVHGKVSTCRLTCSICAFTSSTSTFKSFTFFSAFTSTSCCSSRSLCSSSYKPFISLSCA